MKIVDNLTILELEMNTVIAKQIWSRCNLYVFEEKFESLALILQKAQNLLDRYQHAQLQATGASSIELDTNHKNQPQTWKPFRFN